jgi:hypothetical protein
MNQAPLLTFTLKTLPVIDAPPIKTHYVLIPHLFAMRPH